MSQKIVEKLFNQDLHNYDSKHIRNLSSKAVDQSIIDTIESEGITSEMLDELNHPVCRYKTQITIHGVFPDGADAKRIGGYKNLVKNQNGSLGVRYTAIDRYKKEELYKLVMFARPKYWSVESNSSEYKLQHWERINSKEDVVILKQIGEDLAVKLKNVVYGSVDVNIVKDIFGRLHGVISVNIMAIYKSKMKSVFHKLCPDYEFTMADAAYELAEAERKEEEKRQETKLEYEKRKAQMKEQIDAITAKAHEFALNHGMTFYKEYDCKNKTVIIGEIKMLVSGGYNFFLTLVEGKNKLRITTPLNKDMQRISTKGVKRIQRTILRNVWVKETAPAPQHSVLDDDFVIPTF